MSLSTMAMGSQLTKICVQVTASLIECTSKKVVAIAFHYEITTVTTLNTQHTSKKVVTILFHRHINVMQLVQCCLAAARSLKTHKAALPYEPTAAAAGNVRWDIACLELLLARIHTQLFHISMFNE